MLIEIIVDDLAASFEGISVTPPPKTRAPLTPPKSPKATPEESTVVPESTTPLGKSTTALAARQWRGENAYGGSLFDRPVETVSFGMFEPTQSSARWKVRSTMVEDDLEDE